MSLLADSLIDGKPFLEVAQGLMTLYPPATPVKRRKAGKGSYPGCGCGRKKQTPADRKQQAFDLMRQGVPKDREERIAWLEKVRRLRTKMIENGERVSMLPKRGTQGVVRLVNRLNAQND